MGLGERDEKGRQPIKGGLMSGLLLRATGAQSHWEHWEMLGSKPENLCTNFRCDAHGRLVPRPLYIAPGPVARAGDVPSAQHSPPQPHLEESICVELSTVRSTSI